MDNYQINLLSALGNALHQISEAKMQVIDENYISGIEGYHRFIDGVSEAIAGLEDMINEIATND